MQAIQEKMKEDACPRPAEGQVLDDYIEDVRVWRLGSSCANSKIVPRVVTALRDHDLGESAREVLLNNEATLTATEAGVLAEFWTLLKAEIRDDTNKKNGENIDNFFEYRRPNGVTYASAIGMMKKAARRLRDVGIAVPKTVQANRVLKALNLTAAEERMIRANYNFEGAENEQNLNVLFSKIEGILGVSASSKKENQHQVALYAGKDQWRSWGKPRYPSYSYGYGNSGNYVGGKSSWKPSGNYARGKYSGGKPAWKPFGGKSSFGKTSKGNGKSSYGKFGKGKAYILEEVDQAVAEQEATESAEVVDNVAHDDWYQAEPDLGEEYWYGDYY